MAVSLAGLMTYVSTVEQMAVSSFFFFAIKLDLLEHVCTFRVVSHVSLTERMLRK